MCDADIEPVMWASGEDASRRALAGQFAEPLTFAADAEREAQQVYDVRIPSERIIDGGEFLYVQTRPEL